MLVIFLTSPMCDFQFWVEEVVKMMEFLMTIAVIALVFVAATILVALVARGLLRLKIGIFRREAKDA